MWLLDKMLGKLIQRGQLIVTDHDGKEYRYGPGTEGEKNASIHGMDRGPIRLRLTNPKAGNHIARYPQVGAGEAYMWGWLEIAPPHDIRDLVLFATAQNAGGEDEAFKPQGPLRKSAHWLAAKVDSYNNQRSARKNAEHTYNLTRRLYELFLDEDRQYTMGYHRSPDVSLEEAQVDKKAHIAAKLHMQKGKSEHMKVLDIGCGWGGLALYLHKMYGCAVLGVALAPDQIEFCQERAKAAGVADKVKFKLMDYRDVEGQFDRITSVGLLEHVGTPQYPAFFQHTNRLLKHDGVMFSHCCGRADVPGFTDAWTRKYIFPGGYIPALSELVVEAEKANWQVMDVEAMRFHYSYTLEEWYRRTQLHQAEITELYDDKFYRMWEFYLAGAEQAFRNGKMVNWQIQYVKDRNAIPMTRDYMFEESKRLRESDTVPTWHLDPALREAAE